MLWLLVLWLQSWFCYRKAACYFCSWKSSCCVKTCLVGSLLWSVSCFRYVITEPPDQIWGHRLPNGTWAGMTGMLHRKVENSCIWRQKCSFLLQVFKALVELSWWRFQHVCECDLLFSPRPPPPYIYILCGLEIKIILHLPFHFPEHSQLIIMISISIIITGAVNTLIFVVVFMRHIFSHFMIMIMIIIQ